MLKTRVYVDGFLKFNGMINGCSVRVEGNNKQMFFQRYLIEKIKKESFRDWVIERPITNFIVEYFAVWKGLMIAERYDSDFLYSDSEVIVKQLNGLYGVHKEAHKKWFNMCKTIWKGRAPKLRILWISRTKMVDVLGH